MEFDSKLTPLFINHCSIEAGAEYNHIFNQNENIKFYYDSYSCSHYRCKFRLMQQ